MKSELAIGKNCFVRREDGMSPAASFPGIVTELREGWVRVTGRGDYEWDGDDGNVHRTWFDEWFRIDSPCVNVNPAAT